MTPIDFSAFESLFGSLIIFLVVVAVVFVIDIVLTVLFLKIGIKAVKGENEGFGACFLTLLLSGIVGTLIIGGAYALILFVLSLDLILYIVGGASLVSAILIILIIKSRHETSFFGALGALIIAGILRSVYYTILAVIAIFLLGASLTMFTDLLTMI